MAQYGRPSSDITYSNWNYSEGSTYYGTIDEESADDNDYNYSNANQAATLECGLGSVTDPAVHTGHVLRVRVKANASNKAMPGSLALYEGTTERASWSYDESTWGTSFNTKVLTLTEEQAGNIGSYSDLRVRVTVTSATAGNYLSCSWAELEVPDASGDRQGQISWAELEVPDAGREGQISWAELEVPPGARQGQVSWAELEVPTAGRSGQVSWAELELPDAARQGQVSWAEFEVPGQAREGQVSWAELELPDAGREGQVSWAELEIPTAPRCGQISWAELEVPSPGEPAQGWTFLRRQLFHTDFPR